MRAAGLQGGHRRRLRALTRRDPQAAPAPDLVERNFTPSGPDRLRVADITQQRTDEGWLYLAVVLDCFSRRIVGWSMAGHLRTDLVLDALDMAIAQRNPTTGMVHHSDHGCQYTSLSFGRRLRAAGLVASMGTVGDALDNAVAENFFATLECELLDRYEWPSRQALQTAVFDFIEVFDNRQRRHSTSTTTHPSATRSSTPRIANVSTKADNSKGGSDEPSSQTPLGGDREPVRPTCWRRQGRRPGQPRRPSCRPDGSSVPSLHGSSQADLDVSASCGRHRESQPALVATQRGTALPLVGRPHLA